MQDRLVVVGNGMAGVRTLEELIDIAPQCYEISVFGAEPHGNYNRVLLSAVLAGEKEFEDTVLNGPDWYRERGVTLHAGRRVTGIDRARRCVVADDGTRTPYDRLLLATGSRPVVLPVPGRRLEGVVTFRDIGDVRKMTELARPGRRAVVIGGGLLGLEAAHGLMRRGMDVTVIHLCETLMERQLDRNAGEMLKGSLTARGAALVMGVQTEAILGGSRVEGVRLADGRELPADLVVMAVGIRPETTLAREAGIHAERGIVVGDTLQTFDPRVYAVGECVEHRGKTYGLLAPLFEQARVCANHLAALGTVRYEGSLTSTKLKVTGVELFSAGDFSERMDTESLIFEDAARGVYKKLVVEDDRLRGAVLYGDTMDGAWYFQLMRDGADIRDLREHLLFGQAHLGDAGHGDAAKVEILEDEAEICGCNGVCKGDIVSAITREGLFSLDDVRRHTKASSSCGSCTGLVEALLAATLGSDYSQTPAKKPMCPCTDFSHDEVRAAIARNELKSIRQIMHFLEWREADGCQRCRPALNYYLLCAWPGEYEDDMRSRFVNERAHANIQKDGTYSVVPRIWGGVTTPAELRALADVAERYAVPTVKITGGQRVDLLGVQKADLPRVWADLNEAGFVSGHAYGKAVRTVKTCVGQEWCRFGTQDSTAMGIAVEKMAWGAWTPHKVKLAVSGCPRNCAEATIKDFGVVAVESGWELHVGGNGGVKVRATDLLCKVSSAEEVLEHCAAFLQLYREEARYLERTAPWIERVGLTYVKERVVIDAEGRRALAARFYRAQREGQHDPWQERATGVERGEFTPLREVG
ncbi:MAG: NAD(P)/FAD-dependent oxidoreductase [Gammaproteobacteria bacterium]|nr:NAD(P)/FAD-dependent oxidoreductase [Gammaproteobacteria bacterium]NIR82355.1 NAD(P)/FAD-dependent oxidoreductase [Gammaproteobacteria bacterium]NIR91950.1 NAD(P)/FAD-dependent oxidoreductase [Gammaproteobacteria bacterium]NIV76978.1 FAD-dependent oxidoreductase [Gammaproteobacteria bacterium]